MRSLSVPEMPDCFVAMAVARPNGPWFDGADVGERSCRNETRRYLLENQHHTCGWCQAKTTLPSSHTDHILPKSNPAYSALTFTTANLVASCGATACATCGHHKGGEILPSWIHPYQSANLEGFFSYAIDGEMVPAVTTEPMRTEAYDAINRILNLNDSVLRSQREKLISDMEDEIYEGLSSEEIFAVVGEFKSLIEQYAS